ncbi:MAG: proline racemase family protein, partial [Desulfobacteraceae bacterium]|nr:proline racemase family protein [Desulfobacteraceae bacterium]
RLEKTTSVGAVDAVIPSITGRAWITGTHQHMLDPQDPWPEGYRVADTWPKRQI